jgi:Rrf2 family protein
MLYAHLLFDLNVSILGTVKQDRYGQTMLGSNTHFTIAVHLMTILAIFEDKPAPSSKLAESICTNPAFLRQLIGEMKEAGFVTTKLGTGGGTLLNRPADEIRLLDVYRAIEGEVEIKAHQTDCNSQCPVASQIGEIFHELSGEIDHEIAEILSHTTIADLSKRVMAEHRKSA